MGELRQSNRQPDVAAASLVVGGPEPVASATYIDSDALKATLELTGESFADADVTLACAAASRAIDDMCHRRFWLDTVATNQRYYAARSRRLLEIDDLVHLTALETDEDGDGTYERSWTLNTDFVLEPANAVLDGEPFTLVRRHLRGQFSLPARMPRGVRVTGKFGWPAVPTGVEAAAGILAGRLMRRAREAPFGVIGFAMDMQNAVHLARQDPDVAMLVGPYVRTPTVA